MSINQINMELSNFFQKWRFNKTAIAERLGLTAAGFRNKLSKKNPDKLTEKQRETLIQVLKELVEDLNQIKF